MYINILIVDNAFERAFAWSQSPAKLSPISHPKPRICVFQSRSEQDTATKSGSSDSVNEAIAPRLATSMPPTPASSRRKPDRHTTVSSITARPMSHDLVRETLVDGEVSTREMFRVTKGGGLGRMGWVPRKETAETGEEGQVWRLVPGATAMFEVVATAPEEIAHEGMQFQVRSSGVHPCVICCLLSMVGISEGPVFRT